MTWSSVNFRWTLSISTARRAGGRIRCEDGHQPGGNAERFGGHLGHDGVRALSHLCAGMMDDHFFDLGIPVDFNFRPAVFLVAK